MSPQNGSEHAYKRSDVDSLKPEERVVLRAVAEQTGVVPDGDDLMYKLPEKHTGEEISTVSTVRKGTNLDLDAVNYRLRKLEGKVSSGCDKPLIQTHSPEEPNDPKEIELTEAGIDAIEDGVIDAPDRPVGPTWLEGDGEQEQIITVANRVENLEQNIATLAQMMDLLTHHIGVDPEALRAAVDDESHSSLDSLLRDPEAAGSYVEADRSLVGQIAYIHSGMKAVEKTTRELGGNPREHYHSPEEMYRGDDDDR